MTQEGVTARANLPDHRCSPETFRKILSTPDFFGLTKTYRDFEGMVGWKVEAILKDSWTWVRDLEFLGNNECFYSWLCPNFTPDQLLSGFVPKKLSSTFRALVETSIMIYNCGPDALIPDPASTELNGVHSFAGSLIIKALNMQLRPSNLAKSSTDQLAGLFLLLFGMAMSVSYAIARTKPPEVSLMPYRKSVSSW